MANKELFDPAAKNLPAADSINQAGGMSYQLSAKQALAQLAATGCFNNTYYTSAQEQLHMVLELCQQVADDHFLAQLAVYSRQQAYMKDMPVALLLVLSKRNSKLFHTVFDRVIDNGRMLRSFIQMLRSGQFGRNSLSYSLQRAVQRWLNSASIEQLISASIGKKPSLRDVLRLARPTPKNNTYRAMFGWLTEKEVSKWAPATETDLPEQVIYLQKFRQAQTAKEQIEILDKFHYRWDLLADTAKDTAVWKKMARQMGRQALRMNLNTLLRHGALEDPELVDFIANKIADEKGIRVSRQFPYQYFSAYLNIQADIPNKITESLLQATEIACSNIPSLPGPVVIGLDVSGSMICLATGYRRGIPNRMRCIDVAALFAAAIYRKHPDSLILPFDTSVYHPKISTKETILSLAKRLTEYGGGGTNCSLPLREVNHRSKYRKQRFAGCVLISDNQSWVSSGNYQATDTLVEWQKFVQHQQKFQDDIQHKLVCINIQPYHTTQAPSRMDILNVGGFNDSVFTTMAAFLNNQPDSFVRQVEAIDLELCS